MTVAVASEPAPDEEALLGIPAVDDALDLLWLVDLGQGNLDLADREASRALEAGSAPEALFARAVVHQLRGEYSTALSRFEEAFAGAGSDDARFRISGMAHLCEIVRAGVLPDGRYVCFPESGSAWADPLCMPTPWSERVQSLQDASVAPLSRRVSHLLALLSAAPPARDLALLLRPASSPAKLLRQNADSVREIATWDSNVIHAQVILLIAELHGLGGDLPAAERMLRKLEQNAQSNDDKLIAARALLCRAQILATPAPLGLPALFGYPVHEDVMGNAGLVVHDRSRYTRSGIDAIQAKECYDQARTFFRAIGANRGAALAECGLAYLELVAGNWSAAYDYYAEAQAAFVRVGDVLNQYVAYGGQIMAEWRGEAPLVDLTRACREIGRNARENGRLSWGIGFGLAFAEAGMEALATAGDVEAAERATYMAESLFEALEVPNWCGVACMQRAVVFQTIEASDDAEIALDAALQWQRIAATSEAGARRAALSGIWTAAARLNLASHRTDPDAITRVGEITRALRARLRPISLAEFEACVRDAVDAGDAAAALAREELDSDAIQEHVATMKRGEDAQEVIQEYSRRYLADWIERHSALLAPFWRGVMLIESDRETEARKQFEAALRAADPLPDADYHRANIYSLCGREEEAVGLLRRYVAAGMPFDRPFPKAIDTVPDPAREQSLVGRPRGRPHRLVAQLFAELKCWEDARQHYRQDREDSRDQRLIAEDGSEVNAIDRLYFALIAAGTGDRESALEHFEEAAAGIEMRRRLLRREHFRRSIASQRWVQRIYAEWARVLADAGRWTAAFDIAERGRARVLTEVLAQAKGIGGDLEASGANRAYRQAVAKVERLTSLLATARRSPSPDVRLHQLHAEREIAVSELASQETRLVETFPRRGALTLPDEVLLTVDTLAQRLPRDTVVLAYQFFDERLLGWAVGREGLLAHFSLGTLPDRPFKARPFAARALDWVRRLNEGEDDPTALAADFANALIQPFEDVIARASHVVFIPFAELNMVPLHALAWRGAPLGFSRTTSYLPAASLMRFFRKPRQEAVGAVAVGDPSDMSFVEAATGLRRQLERLEGARVEAHLVARAYRSTPLLGPAATEADVRKALERRPRVVHFATHAYLQPGAPLDSGIALANGGALSADEITGLDLGAEVAVLSACDTGRGTLQGSELVGLTRALLCADVRSAIVALWEVDDTATALLMTRLHRELRDGKAPGEALAISQRATAAVTAAQALEFFRSAEREIDTIADPELPASVAYCVDHVLELADGDLSRTIFSEPEYWAAFALVGSWDV